MKRESRSSPFSLFLVRIRGNSLASRFAVAKLGLGTASLFGLLTSHRSGVRFPDAKRAGALLILTSFASLSLCGYGESNPDPVLGKDVFYH